MSSPFFRSSASASHPLAASHSLARRPAFGWFNWSTAVAATVFAVALACGGPATAATCGDGILETPPEECDPGGQLYTGGNPANGTCTTGSDCFYESTCCKFNCQYANPGPCFDGDACTINDACDNIGNCLGGGAGTGNSCDDGLFCNGPDECDSGACTIHLGDPCAGGAECLNSCDEATDSCVVMAGTPCTDDANDCTDDVCDAMGDCTHPPNSAPCDDGLFCNGDDTCGGGTCSVHSGDPCFGGTDCGETCREAEDDCGIPDGDLCTDDGNPCTDNECIMGTCVTSNNTLACDDGVFCNGADQCSAGACTIHAGDPCAGGAECGDICDEVGDTCDLPLGTGCTDDGNNCTDDECDGAGTCTHPNNAAPCDDGLFCTDVDTCSGGSCVGAPRDCSDGNQCTTDSCDEGGSTCVNTITNGPCEEGDLCTEGDTCVGGVCMAGSPVVCVDGNICTNDLCVPSTGCVFAPNSDPCDDGAYCTVNDGCSGGVCRGQDRDCSDGDQCTSDICNEVSDVCTNPFSTAPCEDGDFCTSGDVCSVGTCLSGGPTDCDDGNPCTDDSCNSGIGCVNIPNSAPCDDGDACTFGDTCSAGLCFPGTESCGNGSVEPFCDEQCDDANVSSGDGCSSTCQSETGDLEARVFVEPANPDPDEAIIYTVVYRNSGPTELDNVVIEAEIDPELSYRSASIDPGTAVGNTLSWSLGTLTQGSSGAILVVADPVAGLASTTDFASCATMSADVAVVGGGEIIGGECVDAETRAPCDTWFRMTADSGRFAGHALLRNPSSAGARLATRRTTRDHSVEIDGDASVNAGQEVRYYVRYRDISETNTMVFRGPVGLVIDSVDPAPDSIAGTTYTWQNLSASAGRVVVNATVAPAVAVDTALTSTATLTNDQGVKATASFTTLVCGPAGGSKCNDRPPSLSVDGSNVVLPGAPLKLAVRYREATEVNTITLAIPSSLAIASVSPTPDSQSPGLLTWQNQRSPSGALQVVLSVPDDALPGTVYEASGKLTNSDNQMFSGASRTTVRSAATDFDGTPFVEYHYTGLATCEHETGISAASLDLPPNLTDLRLTPGLAGDFFEDDLFLELSNLKTARPESVTFSAVITDETEEGSHVAVTMAASADSGPALGGERVITAPNSHTGGSPIVALTGRPAVASGRRMRLNARYSGLPDGNRVIMTIPPEMTVESIAPAGAVVTGNVIVWNNLRGPAGSIRVRGVAGVLDEGVLATYAAATLIAAGDQGSADVQTWLTMITADASLAKRLKLGGQNILRPGGITSLTGRFKRIPEASRLELQLPAGVTVVEQDPPATSIDGGLVVWDDLAKTTSGKRQVRILLDPSVPIGTLLNANLTLTFGGGQTLTSERRLRVR